MVTSPNNNVEIRVEGDTRSLYALKDFRQGQKILDLPSSTQQHPDMYSIEAWPGVHIDCGFSLAGAINHSCSPNAAVRNMSIVAWECIKAGDQITIDYKRTENKLASPFDCNCKSKNCRGRIE